MKPQIPFASRGGCFVLEDSALVPQAIQPDDRVRTSDKFTRRAKPAAKPAPVETEERSAEPDDPMPIDAPTSRRRRK